MQPTNFRDVGQSLQGILTGSRVASGVLLRGGTFDELTKSEDLGYPHTIINLRKGPDPRQFERTSYIHIPAADSVENYETTNGKVRKWLKSAAQAIVAAEPPIYLHCTSGKDRTGVVVAAVLVALKVPRAAIVEEYELSAGAERKHILRALKGLESFDLPARLTRQLNTKLSRAPTLPRGSRTWKTPRRETRTQDR